MLHLSLKLIENVYSYSEFADSDVNVVLLKSVLNYSIRLQEYTFLYAIFRKAEMELKRKKEEEERKKREEAERKEKVCLRLGMMHFQTSIFI